MAACRVLDEATPSPCPWEGEGAGGEGLRLLDGQMGVEDVSPLSPPGERGRGEGSKSGSPFQTDELVTRYGIGARGIEVVSLLPLSANESCRGEGAGGGASETFGFPLYDTHGNMVATLGRSGSSFTLGNEQSYDVWGSVRSGSSSEQQGYVANLGHRADPESFLTYMRARYYEPHTGRFISEDPICDGANWFAYAGNNPSTNVDPSGKSVEKLNPWYWVALGLVWALAQTDYVKDARMKSIVNAIAASAVALRTVKWLVAALRAERRSPGSTPTTAIVLIGGMATALALFAGQQAALFLTLMGWDDELGSWIEEAEDDARNWASDQLDGMFDHHEHDE